MHKNSAEEGITNLGLVPQGTSFSHAISQIKEKRKYHINPYNGGHRLTLCDTLRMAYREIDTIQDCSQKEQIKEYLAQAFDFGKRMDARMKYLKEILDDNGIEYTKSNSHQIKE